MQCVVERDLWTFLDLFVLILAYIFVYCKMSFASPLPYSPFIIVCHTWTRGNFWKNNVLWKSKLLIHDVIKLWNVDYLQIITKKALFKWGHFDMAKPIFEMILNSWYILGRGFDLSILVVYSLKVKGLQSFLQSNSEL